jgi:LmbE family N-acetylglucosaminyl deacetylase
VTFEPNGGYGHPDHIAIHQHTLRAFQLAGDPEAYPELGPAWKPGRLFYTAIPRSFFLEMREGMMSLGQDTAEFDRRMGDTMPGWPDEAIHTTIDVSKTVEAKWEALHCHRTQFGPGNLFRLLPEDRVKAMMGREHFALALPEPVDGLRLEGLFDGMG